MNFTHGLPLCGISLALIEHGRPVLGLIDLPFLGLRYAARHGEGATCNGKRINASKTQSIREALVSIGDYAVGNHATKKNEQRLRLTRMLAGTALRVRMFGSAAIDLAWVAHGRTDASVTLSNKAWDVSAGVVVAREAGANVVDIDGSPFTLDSIATIASTTGITSELIELVRSVLPTPGNADDQQKPE